MTIQNKIPALYLLSVYFFVMIVFSGFFKIFDSLISAYAFFVSIFFLLVLMLLSKVDEFDIKIHFDFDEYISKLLIIITICFIFFVMISPISMSEIIFFRGLGFERYDIRVMTISIPFYWVLESIIKLAFCLSIMFLLKGNMKLYMYCSFIYVMFYVYSMQKYPIGILFLSHLLVYFKCYKIKFKTALSVTSFLFIILIYFYFLTFKEFTTDNLGAFYNALSNRVFATSELVYFVYHEFLENDIQLNGATLPTKFLFIFNLNIFSGEYIKLPALVMEMRTGVAHGGANSAFYTDGLANFGIGYDIAFVILFALLITCLIYLSKLLPDSLSQVYKWYIAINIINVVNIQMWAVLTSCFFVFIFLFTFASFFKILRKCS